MIRSGEALLILRYYLAESFPEIFGPSRGFLTSPSLGEFIRRFYVQQVGAKRVRVAAPIPSNAHLRRSRAVTEVYSGVSSLKRAASVTSKGRQI
jgi:hypothetical protein